MERRKQAAVISLAMWGGGVNTDPRDGDWDRIMGKLHLLLAQLINPQEKTSFVFGDTNRSATGITALLVTESHFYYADFQLRQAGGDSNGSTPRLEVDGTYNLRIAPRTHLKGITVNDIGTSENGMADDVLRTDYTIHTRDFPIAIPVGNKGRDERNKQSEIDLLVALHNDLA